MVDTIKIENLDPITTPADTDLFAVDIPSGDTKKMSVADAKTLFGSGGGGTVGATEIIGRGNIIETGMFDTGNGNLFYDIYEDGTIHQYGYIVQRVPVSGNSSINVATPWNASGTSPIVSAQVDSIASADISGKLSVEWIARQSDSTMSYKVLQSSATGDLTYPAGEIGVKLDVFQYGTGDISTTVEGVKVDGGRTSLWTGSATLGDTVTFSESLNNFDQVEVITERSNGIRQSSVHDKDSFIDSSFHAFDDSNFGSFYCRDTIPESFTVDTDSTDTGSVVVEVIGISLNVTPDPITPAGTTEIIGRGNIIETGSSGGLSYEKFEDGTIHQWGLHTHTGAENTVIYPIPFLSTPATCIQMLAVGTIPIFYELQATSTSLEVTYNVYQHDAGIPNAAIITQNPVTVSIDAWEYGSGDISTTVAGVKVDGGLKVIFAGSAVAGDVVTFSESASNFDALLIETVLAGTTYSVEIATGADFTGHPNFALSSEIGNVADKWLRTDSPTDTGFTVQGGTANDAGDYVNRVFGKNLNVIPESDQFVDLISNQTIGGDKEFTGHAFTGRVPTDAWSITNKAYVDAVLLASANAQKNYTDNLIANVMGVIAEAIDSGNTSDLRDTINLILNQGA